MEKRPIDRKRESAGSFEIDNPEDGTPIEEIFSAGRDLLIFTQKCTYKIQLADQIDPKRENINLPIVVQQKLFDYGTRSELIGRTFLQGKTLFRKEFLPQIDNDAALKLCLEFLSEYVAMTHAMEDFSEAEKQAFASAEKLSHKGSSVTIPSVGNVRSRCKTFSQKPIMPSRNCSRSSICLTTGLQTADGPRSPNS